MIDSQDSLGGPHYDAGLFSFSGRLARLHKGGGRTSGSSKKKGSGAPAIEMPKTPSFDFPDTQMPQIPVSVPAPNQTVTTDTGQAEDDARASALRRKGLASGSTIFAGAGGFRSGNLGGTGQGSPTLGGSTSYQS